MKDTHKYRIRVITRRNGKVSYHAHVRETFLEWIPGNWLRAWEWEHVDQYGYSYSHSETEFDKLEEAKAAIEKHKSFAVQRMGNEIVSVEDIYL